MEYDDALVGRALDSGQLTVLWSVDPRDWSVRNCDAIVEGVFNYVHDGAIILLHEGYASTLEALPLIIEGLRDRGYEFVTVSELLYHQ